MKFKKKMIVIGICLLILLSATIIKAFTINGRELIVREETLKSTKINSDLDGLLICYFTDLNYGSNLNDEDIMKIEETINSFKPDIIIFGGDLILENVSNTNFIESFMSNITSKYGKYAVCGEEDNENTKDLLEQSGFIILNNSNRKLYCNNSFINLVGIGPNINSDLNIIEAYEGVNANNYTIAITHYPDTYKKIDKSKTDYVLSGHSLGGQVYVPLINLLYRPSHAENYLKGKYKENNIVLDISSGLGTKKSDVRMFSDCEIVMYKLRTN